MMFEQKVTHVPGDIQSIINRRELKQLTYNRRELKMSHITGNCIKITGLLLRRGFITGLRRHLYGCLRSCSLDTLLIIN